MGNLAITADSKADFKIMGDLIMLATVQFPTIVREAPEEFGPFLANEQYPKTKR